MVIINNALNSDTSEAASIKNLLYTGVIEGTLYEIIDDKGIIFFNKYLKYKQKYLMAKNMNPLIASINDLKDLTDEEIKNKYLKYKQKYLNAK